MTDQVPSRRRAFSDFVWAFRVARAACPRLVIAHAIATLSMVAVPAVLALSVRGMVNGVNQAVAGQALRETSTYAWLAVGFCAAVYGAISSLCCRYWEKRIEIELRNQLEFQILRHHSAMPFSHLEDREYRNQLRRAQDAAAHARGQLVYLWHGTADEGAAGRFAAGHPACHRATLAGLSAAGQHSLHDSSRRDCRDGNSMNSTNESSRNVGWVTIATP